MRPLIGITTYSQPEVSWGHWTVPSALVPLSYVTAVARAGGRPLLVPPVDGGVGETLDVLDGIVFSGGDDLDPGSYGADAHPETRGTVPQRDDAELALLTGALERDLPVLAVCRGSQILNVARGGDLVQHLPEVVGHEGHRPTPGTFAEHDVTLADGSRLADVLGGEHAPVKSHHHQGYGRVGEGLREVAWAEDGTIEAVEDPTKRFALGVLWHPEEGEDARLFEALVAEATAFRAARSAERGATAGGRTEAGGAGIGVGGRTDWGAAATGRGDASRDGAGRPPACAAANVFRSIWSCSNAVCAWSRYPKARVSPITYPQIPPMTAPRSSVAKPKIAGIGHDSPIGVSGIAPKAAPSAEPATTEPTTNERAFS